MFRGKIEMNIYHRYEENLLYISSDAIARTIAAVKESQNNESFLVRLTDLGIFDSYAGNYKYIVCIDKVMYETNCVSEDICIV